jgi:hypothetical protein
VARRVDDQQTGETDVERLRLLHDLQRTGNETDKKTWSVNNETANDG